MTNLESQVTALLDAINTQPAQAGALSLPPAPPTQFAEPQNDFSMPSIGSMFKISNGNIAVIAVGVISASAVGGAVGGFLPSISKYGSLLGGMLIMYLGRNNGMIRNFGAGVVIGGLASIFSGLGSSISGIFSEPGLMSEDRLTYGGGDGINPVQPDRRTFS